MMGENKNFAKRFNRCNGRKMTTLMILNCKLLPIFKQNRVQLIYLQRRCSFRFQKKDKGNKELSTILESYLNNNSKVNSLFSQNVVLEAIYR